MAEELEKKQENTETPQSEQSPSDDIEIVLDEVSGEKQAEFQKLTPAQKKKHIHEMKEKKIAEKKAKEKADKDAAKKAAKAAKSESHEELDGEPSKKGKLKIILIALVVALIIGGVVAYFLKKKHAGSHELNEKVVMVAPASDSVANEEVAQSVVAENADVTSSQETKDKKKIDKKTKGASQNAAGNLQRPCWLVSYISVTAEKRAQKGVAELEAKGITGGYYWIPDYLPNGNKFFKVYAGPFSSKDAAMSALGSVQSLNQQAYVLLLR